MSGILDNRGKQSYSRGNHKDDLQCLLGWIEYMWETSGFAVDRDGDIFISGSLELVQINRMRRAVGMAPLEPVSGKGG